MGDENRRISVELTIHGAFNKIVNPTAVALEQGQIDTLSDVDKNIPVATTSRKNYLALIIANEKYENWAPVSYASNDGKIFKEYCIKTLGIPEQQVKFINNASNANMGGGLDWLVSEVEMLKEIENPADKRIIVYYAGHGYPVREGNYTESYLIPVDCNNVTSGKYSYSLSNIYDRLGALGVGSLTFFLDACFSGSDRSGAALVEGQRGVAIAPKSGSLSGNTVVFSAVNKDQTAHPYRDKRHGMFTYYLLKAMQESEGEIAYGELSKTIEANVVKTMIRDDKGLVQNPTTEASSAMKVDNKWEQLKF
ncbi:MAG: caspase family protein [Rikenellaceae bacterium]